jgi:enamine deaminase RidA (YjgF/YER057c/UK114 family)
VPFESGLRTRLGDGTDLAGRLCDLTARYGHAVVEIILATLADAGAAPGDIVRTRMFITSVDNADAVGRVHGELFADVRPAATMVVVAGLLDSRWLVEIEAGAVVGAGA